MKSNVANENTPKKNSKEKPLFKKIKIKQTKPDINTDQITSFNKHPSVKLKEDKIDNEMFDDINSQLDDILANIDNDSAEEVNQKIKQLNKVNVSHQPEIKNSNNFIKIDNKSNKIPTSNFNNNFFNYTARDSMNRKHFLEGSNKNHRIYCSNTMSSRNKKYMKCEEENNCQDDDDENEYEFMNKTNINLFYKYNIYANKNNNTGHLSKDDINSNIKKNHK